MNQPKYKTNHEALNFLKFDVVKKIMHNIEHVTGSKHPEAITKTNYSFSFIEKAFDWKKTKEGWEYWVSISDQWKLEWLKQNNKSKGLRDGYR